MASSTRSRAAAAPAPSPTPDAAAGPFTPSSSSSSSSSKQAARPSTSFAADPSAVIALVSFALGGVFFASLALALPLVWRSAPKVVVLPSPLLPAYLASWSFFHLMEYLVTAVWNPTKVGADSFLLTNGKAYHVAHALGIAEYLFEAYYYPSLKRVTWVKFVGLALVAGGQVIRSLAMVHASHSFSHYVAFRKKDDHVLVTTGIYAYARHPSYCGFYWWAVGTQILLGNPFTSVAFGLFLWRWFFRRIGQEEQLLVRFFGDDYVKYRDRVVSGLPLLR